MLAIVVIGLMASVLVLVGVGLFAVLDVAFSGPPELQDQMRWQPPLARGDDLLAWATGMANAVATKKLRQPLGKETPRELAREIFEGSSFAIAKSPVAAHALKPRCTSCRHRMIGVTAPEALAIADSLRMSQGKGEVKRVQELATTNAAASASLDHEHYKKAQLTCPLLATDSTCVIYDARPIQCRGSCPPVGEEASLAKASGSCRLRDPHADAVGRGAEEGLSLALESAGLGGEIYELNSALATALGTSNASQRWVRGERIFAGCHEYA